MVRIKNNYFCTDDDKYFSFKFSSSLVRLWQIMFVVEAISVAKYESISTVTRLISSVSSTYLFISLESVIHRL